MSPSVDLRPRRSWRVAVLASLALAVSGLATPPALAADPATPTPDTVFSDDFERADGDVGNGWVATRGTWGIRGGDALTTATGAQNNVITQDGVELGRRWSVEADIRVAPYSPASGREWSGVAGNVRQASGGLSYYALRVTTASPAAGSTGRWALIRMTNNSSAVALAQGNFTGPASLPNHAGVTTTLSRDGRQMTAEVIDPQGTSLVNETVTIPADPTAVGGRAGLYTVTDNLRAKDVEIRTSTPAVQPPGALDCDNATGSYTFPTGGSEVIDSSELGITWAGMFVVQDLLTRGDDQYVGFYDKDRNMVIAHRSLPEGEWRYEILDSRIAWDSHNYISLGLDRDDTLHVSGNMHNVRLNYWRSAAGGDIATLERQQTMVSAATENSVTYPEFVNRKDGSLVFSYRNGGSGSGVTYFNVYDEQTDSWSRLVDQPFFNGIGSASNPGGTWSSYFQGPTLGPDGMFHMVWVWRDTPDAATNSMLTYAKSEDLVTWVDAAGNRLSTPFKYGEGDVIDPIPDFAGLLNGNARIGFTDDDEVLVSYHKYDDDGHSQIYAATPQGADWKINQISDWEGRWSFGGGGTLIFEVQMRGSEVLSDGNVQVNLLCSGVPQSIVIDPDLEPLAQAPTPPLPGGLGTVRGTYPGLQAYVMNDRGDVPEPATDRGRYVLRWESLPENRDIARSEWPQDGTPIEVVLLGDRPVVPEVPTDPGTPTDPVPPAAPAPTGTLSSTVGSSTTDRSFPVTVTFDQPVSGLDLSDLVVENGAARDLTGSGATYAFTVTAERDGAVAVSIPANAVRNAGGSGNQAVPALSVDVRTTAPEAPLELGLAPVGGDGQRATLQVGITGQAATDAVVTATSSNDRLLPSGSLRMVDDEGASRELVIAPVADRVGTATVILTAEVDGTTVTTQVTVHVGGRWANQVVGGPGVDVMFGRGGDDRLAGRGGNDLLVGGWGRDVLRGGAGDDVLVAGVGGSRLVGGPGADVFDAEPRRDVLVDFDREEGDTRRS